MADPYAERGAAEAADQPAVPAAIATLIGELGGRLAGSPTELLATSERGGGPQVIARRDEGLLPPLARLGRPLAAALLAGDAGSAADAAAAAETAGEGGAPAPVLLVKVGLIGGPAGSPGCVAVPEELIGTALRAAVEGALEWERDPDFGWELPLALPGAEIDDRILCPRLLYAAADRVYEHAELVAATKQRWYERLPAGSPPALAAAIGWPPQPTGSAWKH